MNQDGNDMAIYEYKCDACGNFDAEYPIGTAPSTEECAGCGNESDRVYSIYVTEVMHEHWDMGVQAPISTPKQHAALLKRQGEEATERTGILHNFEPIPLGDLPSTD